MCCGLGFRVWGLGFRVKGLGFRVQGSVFNVECLVLSVLGLGVWGDRGARTIAPRRVT